MGFRTRQIHSGVTPDPTTGSILTPIYQSTTYVQPSVDEYLSKGFTYARSGNPTVKVLEDKLTDLEEYIFGFNPYVHTDPSLIETLIQFARPYIYTTATSIWKVCWAPINLAACPSM